MEEGVESMDIILPGCPYFTGPTDVRAAAIEAADKQLNLIVLVGLNFGGIHKMIFRRMLV
jgi:hypothetical protein